MTLANEVRQYTAEKASLEASKEELAAAMEAAFAPHIPDIEERMGEGLKITKYETRFTNSKGFPPVMLAITEIARDGVPLEFHRFSAEISRQGDTRDYFDELEEQLGYNIDFVSDVRMN